MRKISKIDMDRKRAKIELLANEFLACYKNFTKKHEKFLDEEDEMWIDFPVFAAAIALFSRSILESHPADVLEIEKELKDKFMFAMNKFIYNEVDISE